MVRSSCVRTFSQPRNPSLFLPTTTPSRTNETHHSLSSSVRKHAKIWNFHSNYFHFFHPRRLGKARKVTNKNILLSKKAWIDHGIKLHVLIQRFLEGCQLQNGLLGCDSKGDSPSNASPPQQQKNIFFLFFDFEFFLLHKKKITFHSFLFDLHSNRI